MGSSRFILSLMLIVALSACTPTMQPRPVTGELARTQYLLGLYEISPPRGSDWYEMPRAKGFLAYGKKLETKNRTFAASVHVHDVSVRFASESDFLAFVKSTRASDTDPDRFDQLLHDEKLDGSKAPFCTRFHLKAEDKVVSKSSGIPSFLEAKGFSCLHPNKQKIVTVEYSERAPSPFQDPILLAEGEHFINSLVIREAAEKTARIVDTSTGDSVEEPTGWKRLLLRRGSGMPGGGFFFVREIDGVTEPQNNMDESVLASYGQGRSISFKKVERPVPAGKHRIKLAGRYVFAAPIDNLLRSAADYRVEGEIEVTLLPAVEYRVRGVLEEFRQEVWLEESVTGKRIGEKIVNIAVEDDRIRAMAGASFACCNLHYQDEWISDENLWGLPFIPAGTPIAIREYGRNRIHVLVDGRQMTIGHDYGRKQETKEQLVAKLVVKDDPSKLIASYSPAIQEAIRSGKLLRGMSKQQVILSLGFPRPDLTTSLDSPVWKYSTADDGDVELIWGTDGLLSELKAEEKELPAKILFTGRQVAESGQR